MATQRAAKTAKAVRKPTMAVKKSARRVQPTSHPAPARSAAKAAAPSDYEGVRQLLSTQRTKYVAGLQ